MVVAHYRLSGNVSEQSISAAKQSVQTLKLDYGLMHLLPQVTLVRSGVLLHTQDVGVIHLRPNMYAANGSAKWFCPRAVYDRVSRSTHGGRMRMRVRVAVAVT